MDRALWKRFLAQADQHILDLERNIARLRELIAELERDDQDTQSAREFLMHSEATLAALIRDRDLVKAEVLSNEKRSK